jgi:lysophospholipase L1-like esterase
MYFKSILSAFLLVLTLKVVALNPVIINKELPEGRYLITMKLGGNPDGSHNMVKAESRRLMLENIVTKPGETKICKIAVDVRTPQINGTDSVRIKPRERSYINWDNKLTIEITGEKPVLKDMKIKKADHLPVIYLAGNSTVTDQENDPYASWGQMLPVFLKSNVVVANYAESGETLKAFKRERRLEKIISMMKKGDYLLIEFAHNDQKPGGNYLEPFTTYKEELRFFISEARRKGGQPVLVTSTMRRRFDDKGKIVNTLGDYPEAMRQLSKEVDVPLIDLNAMSKTLLEAMGEEKSLKALVHHPANTYPGQTQPLADNTHFSPYGAYELAKCVAGDILKQNLPLKKFLRSDFKGFDPAKPDYLYGYDFPSTSVHSVPAESVFRWFESSRADVAKPDGN